MTKKLRKTSKLENAILDKLLSEDFPGRDILLEQIALSKVYDHPDGSGTIFFEFDRPVKEADIPGRVPVEAKFKLNNGTIDIILHVLNGVISELEVVRYSEDNNEPIDPERLKVQVNREVILY